MVTRGRQEWAKQSPLDGDTAERRAPRAASAGFYPRGSRASASLACPSQLCVVLRLLFEDTWCTLSSPGMGAVGQMKRDSQRAVWQQNKTRGKKKKETKSSYKLRTSEIRHQFITTDCDPQSSIILLSISCYKTLPKKLTNIVKPSSSGINFSMWCYLG